MQLDVTEIDNPNFVMPRVFWIGATGVDINGIIQYLEYTGQEEFRNDMQAALDEGLNDGEIMVSFYAKLCYASLTDKKNLNISKVRSIHDNILSIIDSKHGSVLEHCSLNFVVTECSRVFTHELVRHRVGTAFSQTSGRYVRSDILKIVHDPILEDIEDDCEELRKITEDWYNRVQLKLKMNEMTNFDKKKKITSALRRYLPNGQANEIGFTVNLRTLRQTIEARTSRHAEWEIRVIFNQIYEMISNKYPVIFSDSEIVYLDGLNEITFKNKKI